jgi:hypothetical protein
MVVFIVLGLCDAIVVIIECGFLGCGSAASYPFGAKGVPWSHEPILKPCPGGEHQWMR